MPESGVGRFIGLGRETVLGTTVARSVFPAAFRSESLRTRQSIRYAEPLRSASAEAASVSGGRRAEGEIVCVGSYVGLESLIKDAMGSVTTGDTAGSNKSHDFALETALPSPGLSIECDRGGASFLFADCKVDSMSIVVSPDDFAMFTFGIVGREATTPAASTPTYTGFQPIYGPPVVTLELDDATFDVDRVEIELTNGLAANTPLGASVVREPVRAAHRVITARFPKDFEDATEWAKFKAGTPVKLALTLEGEVISGAENYQLAIVIPKLVYDGDIGPVVAGPGIISEQLQGRAIMDSAINDEMTMSLQNDTASVT